ncbi:MAG: hypothetical protein AB7T27_01180 [Kiritimatiellia bacterium]
MSDLFNNREIATGIWLVIVAIWAGQKDGIRESFLKMFKTFRHPKIIIPVLLMVGYLWLEVFLLSQWELWNMSLLKDTIYWFILTGIVLFLNIVGEKDSILFLKKTAIECVAVTVILQFMLNLYTFSLWGELIFIPGTTLLAMMTAVAEITPEYAPAKKLFDGILSIIGLGMVIYLIRMTWLHHSELSASKLLLTILNPIMLTFLFFPFLYIAKLVSDYEMFFVRLQFHITNDDELLSYTRLKTLLYCNINLPRLNRFEKYLLSNVWDTRDRDGINRIIQRFKSGQSDDNPNENRHG